MNYNETLEYIHSVSNFFCKPGLDRIGQLCERLRNPQNDLKYVHVAGTNGKGSFCSMLSNVLYKAGYKVGLYTSPYILEFNERICINGMSISNDDLCRITEKVKLAADLMEDKPTEFELITAVAFEYFKEQNCDVVVLECGLGGRYDATNIISNSVLSVITGISIDHTSFLGNTVEQIAGEKAGIIKDNGKCLWCGDSEVAKNVILKETEKKSAEFFTVDKHSLVINNMDLNGTDFDYDRYQNIKIKLLGSFQPFNACNVISAVRILNDSGFKISEYALREGLFDTVWHARFEIINNSPLIIADGGHNPEGVEVAVDSIKQYFDQKVIVVTGVMKDKDYNYIAEKIGSIGKRVYCITADNPRALSAESYATVFTNNGVEAIACSDVKSALINAIKYSSENSLPIVALGSLYMYKEIIETLKSIV